MSKLQFNKKKLIWLVLLIDFVLQIATARESCVQNYDDDEIIKLSDLA